MRIETVSQIKDNTWSVGLVGVYSEKFRKVTLTQEQLSSLKILSTRLTFAGDSNLVS